MHYHTARLGQCLRIGDGLEVVVMKLEPRHVILGIRQLCNDTQDLTEPECTCPRACHAYYRSGNGRTILVVHTPYGRAIQINERTSLQAIRRNLSSVQLISGSADRCDTPSLTHRSWPFTSTTADDQAVMIEAGVIQQSSSRAHPAPSDLPASKVRRVLKPR